MAVDMRGRGADRLQRQGSASPAPGIPKQQGAVGQPLAASPGQQSQESSRSVSRQDGSMPMTGQAKPESAASVRRASARAALDHAGGEKGAALVQRPGALAAGDGAR